MSPEKYVAIAFFTVLTIIVVFILLRLIPRQLKHDKYADRWKKLQALCAEKETWPEAIRMADDLLGDALKKRKYRGGNTGERLVNAQKVFTNNDAVWFGHKLRTKLDENPALKLGKEDVQRALIGLRQGLKDIGAMK